MNPITSIHQAIINYLVAENEEIPPPEELADYMRAIEGRFERDMRFTLYKPENAGIVLCIRDNEKNQEQCKDSYQDIKNKLLIIADFIRYMVQAGMVHVILRDKTEFPAMSKQWQVYTDFTPEEQSVLEFALSVQIIPRLQLYDYWEAMHTQSVFSYKDTLLPVQEKTKAFNQNLGNP